MKRDLICSSFKVLHVFVYWSNNVFEIVEYAGVGFFSRETPCCALSSACYFVVIVASCSLALIWIVTSTEQRKKWCVPE